jgi:hypothetical protein
MPQLYLITVCAASSLDQHSNNVSLFNLVEQLNVPPAAPPPPGGLVPLEMHAYFVLSPDELGRTFDVRFAMIASGSGLETFSEIFSHRSVTPRYRTRTLGLPYPPVTGQYELRVDWRPEGHASWKREGLGWPLLIVEATPTPRVTH